MIDTEKVDFGSIHVHKEVLADITYNAVQGFEQVHLVSDDLKSRVMGWLGKRRHPGILVSVDKEGQVMIEVRVLARFGVNLPDLARQIQDAIRGAIEETVDITIKAIHVNIQGLERGDS